MKPDIIICDFCKKQENLRDIINWLNLTSLGHIVRAFGDENWDDKDFCSISCLIDWAEKAK